METRPRVVQLGDRAAGGTVRPVSNAAGDPAPASFETAVGLFPAYYVTIKVEHLLVHAELLPVLQQTGCLFVTTAVESVDDKVLAILEKGHTREDFFQVVRLFDEAGLSLSP